MKTKEVKRAEAIIRYEERRPRELKRLQQILNDAETSKDKGLIESARARIKEFAEKANPCVPKVGNRLMRLSNGKRKPMVDRSVMSVMNNASLVPAELLTGTV